MHVRFPRDTGRREGVTEEEGETEARGQGLLLSTAT